LDTLRPDPGCNDFPYSAVFRSSLFVPPYYSHVVAMMRRDSLLMQKRKTKRKSENTNDTDENEDEEADHNDAQEIDGKVMVDEDRSEDHTSELQSRFDLVCRPLL